MEVFQGLYEMQGDDLVVIEPLGKATALFDHPGHRDQEAL